MNALSAVPRYNLNSATHGGGRLDLYFHQITQAIDHDDECPGCAPELSSPKRQRPPSLTAALG
jgi:hypothetical protein